MNNYIFSPQIELLNFNVFLCLFVCLFLIERLGSKPTSLLVVTFPHCDEWVQMLTHREQSNKHFVRLM